MHKPRPKSAIQLRTKALIALLAIILTGCKPSMPKTVPEGEITVPPGEILIVRAIAKGAVTYRWQLQGEGQISSSEGPAILYTAPDEKGKAILSVTAHNAWGASPSAALTIRPPAFVSLDALAMPLVWISSDGNKLVDLEGSPNGCHSGSDCLRFTYAPGGGWGELQWRPLCIASATSPTLSPIPDWPFCVAHVEPEVGCSINVLKAGNLGEVSRLVFWVRGDKGGEIVKFGIGCPDMEPIPGRSTENITLQPAWERREIDLADLDLTKATVLFRWCATDVHNLQGAVFYLDDIQFEGVRQVH